MEGVLKGEIIVREDDYSFRVKEYDNGKIIFMLYFRGNLIATESGTSYSSILDSLDERKQRLLLAKYNINDKSEIEKINQGIYNLNRLKNCVIESME